jgi:hypothetical protein
MEPRKRITLKEAAALVRQLEDDLAQDGPKRKRELSTDESPSRNSDFVSSKRGRFGIALLIGTVVALALLYVLRLS